MYKVDNVYAPQSEACILWSDADLAIKWPVSSDNLILSPKDLKGVPFSEAEVF